MADKVRLPVNVKFDGLATGEDARDVAQGIADAVNEVGRVLGATGPLVTVGGINRLCDCCGAHAPDAELPADWVSDDEGQDFCATCAIALSEEKS